MKLRDYQEEIAEEGLQKLRHYKLVYLSMEVRTGKTITSLTIADRYLEQGKRVLFITKKKAISSIEHDYTLVAPGFEIEVINYESLHKVEGCFDLLIIDEAHRLGGFPKPNKAAKHIKDKYSHLPMIFLSGTPTPESYSQIFHQFFVSQRSPFAQYKNFYKWAVVYVNVKERNFGYANIKDYSGAREDRVLPVVKKYFITYTQREAGFTSSVREHILKVAMKPITKQLISTLKRDSVVQGKNDTILADTSVKLMGKVHQLCSGTVIGESGKVILIDNSKAVFIRRKFNLKKIAIFYKFRGELDLLKDAFGETLTTDLEEFNTTDKCIALQIVSGREGISLKAADCLVYFNIDFSAVSYWQSRDRLTTKERSQNDIYWIFSEGGIETNIYKAVESKKDYTLSHFKRDERTEIPNQNH